MDDKLYKQRRNLFIKREAFESRLIKYLERLIIHMNNTGEILPADATIAFSVFEKNTEHTDYDLYSRLADTLFKNMKNVSAEKLSYYDNILDDFHHELDEYEEELNEVTSTNH